MKCNWNVYTYRRHKRLIFNYEYYYNLLQLIHLFYVILEPLIRKNKTNIMHNSMHISQVTMNLYFHLNFF